jgi:hypothetical protein
MALLPLVLVTPSMQWAPEPASPRCRTPFALLPHTLVDSRVAWSRRYLYLYDNALTSNGLLNVTWPEDLE